MTKYHIHFTDSIDNAADIYQVTSHKISHQNLMQILKKFAPYRSQKMQTLHALLLLIQRRLSGSAITSPDVDHIFQILWYCLSDTPALREQARTIFMRLREQSTIFSIYTQYNILPGNNDTIKEADSHLIMSDNLQQLLYQIQHTKDANLLWQQLYHALYYGDFQAKAAAFRLAPIYLLHFQQLDLLAISEAIQQLDRRSIYIEHITAMTDDLLVVIPSAHDWMVVNYLY